MAGVKWSDDTAFPEGSECQIGDKIVGLRSGENYKFDFPSDGIKDANGNYLIGWASSGAATTDYMQFTSGEAGTPSSITLFSSNADANMDIVLKGTGVLDIIGLYTVNGTTSINAIYDTDTLSEDSASALATQQSIKAYVDNKISVSLPTLTNGQLYIGDTGNDPQASTLTAGTGITIDNAAGSITINGTGGGYSWTEVTGTSQNMAVNNGYIANNASQVDCTLPATASIGDTVIIQGKGSGGWKISQNAGQTIHFGASDTTTGTGGSLESTNQYDSVELLCITADTDWAVLTAPQGTLTVN